MRTWIQRSPREWLWVFRRRLHPDRSYHIPFDGDLTLEIELRDELSLRYALGSEFEPDVAAFFRQVIQPGAIVMDVGANIGQFTLLAAKRVQANGQVHSFEASPHEFRKLVANISLNHFGNVRANPMAVCDRTGSIRLNLCDPGLGLYNSIGQAIHASSAAVEVPCTTLDDYVKNMGIDRVDLLKIDVEGAELLTVRGAAALLSGADAPMVVCEFSDLTLQGMGQTTRELRRAFEDYGYHVFRYSLDSKSLAPEPERNEYEYDNLICMKDHTLRRFGR